MPLILPPTFSEPVEVVLEPDESRAERIRKFLDVPNWICPNCRLTNFGRNKHCADLRCRYAPERQS